MTNEQKAAYIAGFFDGEGCIGQWRLTSGYPTRSITACNTEKALFATVCEFLSDLGFQIRIYRTKAKKPGWADREVVSIAGGRAGFTKFRDIIPLQSKAKQDDLVALLASYVEDRGAKQRTRVIRKCEVCGGEFMAFPAYIARGQARFCSVSCRGLAQRDRVTIICEYCGKSFSTIRALSLKARFCSHPCHGKANSTHLAKQAKRAAAARWNKSPH